MMRRVDLLPPVYVKRRKERRDIALVIVAGLVIVVLLLGWWFILGVRVNDAEQELTQVQQRNQDLQADIAQLQQFVDLQNELDAKQVALQQVMAGDVDWPAVLTEIAMVVPGEIWLTNLNASAGQTEGAAPVGTETAPIRISSREPFGRIQFQGNSLTMPGVAKWMIRLESVEEFFAVYLNRAGASEVEGRVIAGFDSTLELSNRAASGRFQGETP